MVAGKSTAVWCALAAALAAVAFMPSTASALGTPLTKLVPLAVTPDTNVADAANLIDGESTTSWLSAGLTASGSTAPVAAIVLDLSDEDVVTGVQIAPASTRTFFPTRFAIQTSDDDVNYSTVAVATGVKLSPKAPGLFFQIDDFNAMGRYVRIVCDTVKNPRDKKYHAQIAEITLYTGEGFLTANPTSGATMEVPVPTAFSADPFTTSYLVTGLSFNFSNGRTQIPKALQSQDLISFKVKGDTLTPTDASWKAVKRIAADDANAVYWWPECTNASLGLVLGPVRQGLFLTGGLDSNDITPTSLVDGDLVLLPEPMTAPTFSWVYGGGPMTKSYAVISTDPSAPLDKKHSIIVPSAGVPVLTTPDVMLYTLKASEWKTARKMAATTGGGLWARYIAYDKDRIIGVSSVPVEFTVSAGTISLLGVTLELSGSAFEVTPADAVFAVETPALAQFKLQWSGTNTFPAGKTAYIPAKTAAGSPIHMTAADVKALNGFIKSHKLTTLFARVIGADSDGAFSTKSQPIGGSF